MIAALFKFDFKKSQVSIKNQSTLMVNVSQNSVSIFREAKIALKLLIDFFHASLITAVERAVTFLTAFITFLQLIVVYAGQKKPQQNISTENGEKYFYKK